MNKIVDLLKDTLENYEYYRKEFQAKRKEKLTDLNSKLVSEFTNLISDTKVGGVKIKLTSIIGNPPGINKFAIAFLEPNHKIIRGIYSGIKFHPEQNKITVIFNLSSEKSEEHKPVWEDILKVAFDKLEKEYNWDKPTFEEHSWRIIYKSFFIEDLNTEVKYTEFINTILTGIWITRQTILHNQEEVKEYLGRDILLYYDDTIAKKLTEFKAKVNTSSIEITEEEIKKYSSEEDYEQIHYGKEGAIKTLTSKVYERVPKLRKACIEHYTTEDIIKCEICGFDFQNKYGEAGEEIIDIHHKKPLNEINEVHLVNPIEDLIPVCSNCHRVIHSKRPAYSVDEVKAMIAHFKAK